MDTASIAPDVHHNPFEVLELGATASARDVTRQKDKLLGMLELGLDRAKRFTSSSGDQERTADLVRSAAQELERPRSRLSWELWLKPSDAEVDADPDAASMRTALLLHHELLRETAHGIAFGVDELDELGAAWDEALGSGGLYDRVAERASELGIEGDEDEVIDELREEIRGQMLTMLERGPVLDLDELSSEIASDVAHAFADRKVELLELACSRMANAKVGRLQRQQQWHGLVNEYAATVNGRGLYLRRAAFQAVNAGLADLAVDLFNKDQDHALALSMFAWLRDEASNLGDDGLLELHRENVTIVQARIARDNAALEAAQRDLYAHTSSNGPEWSAWNVLVLCAGLVLGVLRVSKGCDEHHETPMPTISPPSYSPELYRPDPELLKSLREMRELQPPTTDGM